FRLHNGAQDLRPRQRAAVQTINQTSPRQSDLVRLGSIVRARRIGSTDARQIVGLTLRAIHQRIDVVRISLVVDDGKFTTLHKAVRIRGALRKSLGGVGPGNRGQVL